MNDETQKNLLESVKQLLEVDDINDYDKKISLIIKAESIKLLNLNVDLTDDIVPMYLFHIAMPIMDELSSSTLSSYQNLANSELLLLRDKYAYPVEVEKNEEANK